MPFIYEHDNIEGIERYRKFFNSAFDLWTRIHNRLAVGLEEKSMSRIQKSYDQMIELIDTEIKYIKEMMERYEGL